MSKKIKEPTVYAGDRYALISYEDVLHPHTLETSDDLAYLFAHVNELRSVNEETEVCLVEVVGAQWSMRTCLPVLTRHLATITLHERPSEDE